MNYLFKDFIQTGFVLFCRSLDEWLVGWSVGRVVGLFAGSFSYSSMHWDTFKMIHPRTYGQLIEIF